MADKILYFLDHFKNDVKIINNELDKIGIEQVLENDPDYQIILKGREERKTNPENYISEDDVDWNTTTPHSTKSRHLFRQSF